MINTEKNKKHPVEDTDFLSRHLPYPQTTMFGAVEKIAKRFPAEMAYEFMGKVTSYSQMLTLIENAAKAFLSQGIQRGDIVTICLPNVPQAIICLYALNRIGAIASMIHPLSSQKEITYYLDDCESKMIVTLDLFYEKVAKARRESKNQNTIILMARIQDELSPLLAFAYYVKKGKDYKHLPNEENSICFKAFISNADKNKALPQIQYDKNKVSVLLYSGGTTGKPKGIELSDYNFNALGMQIREVAGIDFKPGIKFLSVMPVFHGFGLGIGIHTILINGAGCILVPQFNDESYAKLIIKHRPNFIAGVPTIYAALLKSDVLKKSDLSCLYGVFSGGDTLPTDLKHQFDAFLKEHNATVQIREGYGLTECVTASCLTPVNDYRENSIGLPLRDMVYKIVSPDTFEELPIGEEGEIILTGPTLMLGYRNQPQETEKVLRKDESGTTWLFTGDLGKMDKDGYVYFIQRIKRLIVTSGYNVYPSQVENALDLHQDVDYCCVIGVPDERRIEKIRAYVVLKNGVDATENEKKKLLEHCKLYLAGYAKPREIIFRKELPKTLVGKVAYHVLEEEAQAELRESL